MIKINLAILLIIAILAILPIGIASPIKVDYQIFGDKTLVEMEFDSVDNLELKLPYDSAALELNNQTYNLEEFDSYKILKVASARNLSIKYITSSLIEVSKDKYFFVLTRNFDGMEADINIFLPEGAVLPENKLIFPKEEGISTDGRRIIVSWNGFKEENILVAYEYIKESNLIYWILIGILVILFAAYARVKRKKFGRKVKGAKLNKEKKAEIKKGELTRNLFEEEKKIVEYLLLRKNNEGWTKEVARDLNIPKVRLSRKLRNLEQKGLIKRTPYGNENRIKLMNK